MPIEEDRAGRGTGHEGALTREQLENAALIYHIGKRMGMSNRDIQIALITAMQESSLRNLDYGDRDSRGLFQQRPSQGWGTVAQVTNPVYATRKFFSVLKTVGNRNNMSMTQAAQAVQRSAYPDAYAKHIPMVRSIWPQLTEPSKGREPRPDRGGGSREPVEREVELDRDAWLLSKYAAQDPSVNPLAAQWNPLLAAPTFFVADQFIDPDPETGMLPDWASTLSAQTFETVQDRAAANGSFTPSKGVDGWRAHVVQLGRDQLGTPYVWGGTSPDGFDCSGLLQYIYSKAGINLPRISYQQANYGKKVGLGQLRPGDLVAWDNSSRNNGADHIAMYIGNGRILEAAKPGTRVRIRRLGHSEGAWGVRINR